MNAPCPGIVTITVAAGLALLAGSVHADLPDDATAFRVMSFNLWHGGDEGGQPLAQTIAVIRAADADIVGIQETHGHADGDGPRPNRAAEIAVELGWHFVDQGDRTGILSRHPIVGTTPRRWGAAIELPDGTRLMVFNAHLAASPYQPYQLLGIEYFDAPTLSTAEEAIEAARETRGAAVGRLLDELRIARLAGAPVVLTGDFNEPSHLDWTPRAVEAGLAPLAVAYPTSLAIVAAGMVDAYRQVHPDEVVRPGWTWTPTTAEDDPKDRHDRIDMVYACTETIEIVDCGIVGERTERADIVVTPYPSDHRAVVATLRIKRR